MGMWSAAEVFPMHCRRSLSEPQWSQALSVWELFWGFVQLRRQLRFNFIRSIDTGTPQWRHQHSPELDRARIQAGADKRNCNCIVHRICQCEQQGYLCTTVAMQTLRFGCLFAGQSDKGTPCTAAQTGQDRIHQITKWSR